MKWHFRSRADVIPALKKTRGHLRKTYEVLMCAVRQGYSNTAYGFYEEVMAGNQFDASLADCAAYSFAFDTSDGFRPWNWKKDQNSKAFKSGSKAGIWGYRNRAFQMGRGVPEVMVMRILWESTSNTSNGGAKRAYQLAQEAVKRAPNWADGYYWLHWANSMYATSLMDFYPGTFKDKNQAIRARLARLELRSCDQAERLDPGLRPYFFMVRAQAHATIADKRSAQLIPRYVDLAIRETPGFMAWYSARYNKSEATFRKGWADQVTQIAKEAKT